jgi:hypothetical protein
MRGVARAVATAESLARLSITPNDGFSRSPTPAAVIRIAATGEGPSPSVVQCVSNYAIYLCASSPPSTGCRRLPVVVLTSSNHIEDIDRAYDAGTNS